MREVKKYKLLFSTIVLCIPSIVFGACSTANINKCLDSVCAINIGANPAARCQYCGSADSGVPAENGGMKKISAGANSKYTLTDKELKKAPKDPGERYVWAREKCFEKVDGCSSISEDEQDEIEEAYDKLIEQSCKAAGISMAMNDLTKKQTKAKTESACSSEIKTCLLNDKHCTANYSMCKEEADFDKHFADCSVAATGCEQFLNKMRGDLFAARKEAIDNVDKILDNIVASYKQQRETKLSSIKTSCKDGSAKNSCIETVCKNNMRNKCATGFEQEKNMALQLCKFYETACQRLQ